MCLFAVSISACIAQDNLEVGSRLAKEMINLVIFSEMGNIASRDPDCEGTPFPITDIDSLIGNELAPTMDGLHRATGQLGPGEREEAIALFRTIPTQKLNGVGVVMQTYQKAKQQAVSAYGADGACVGLSSMIQTIVHQKRLALQNLMAEIKQP
jgi:hypothetical protein